MAEGVVLVAGSHGLIGRHVCEQLLAGDRWEVLGASRRAAGIAGTTHLALDLEDADASRQSLAELGEVTHLVFAAYAPDADPSRESERNRVLLANALAGLAAAGAPLRHVTLYQGAKAYGAHLGPFPTPALEDDPRVLGPLFYYAQEDLLRAEAERQGFAFTIFRPDFILGIAEDNAINILLSAAVYGAYCRVEGVPFRFPGSPGAYEALLQMTDAGLLARATEWAMDAASAANQVFNVTNGDHIRWSRQWPLLAAALELEPGGVGEISLRRHVAGRPDVWQEIVAADGLRPSAVERMVSWDATDFMFSITWDVHSSTVKLRQAGFGESLDTAQRIGELVAQMRAERVVP
jgi:nucleoside-diphosphate-sugar epimerase